jgi:hypothetical protein
VTFEEFSPSHDYFDYRGPVFDGNGKLIGILEGNLPSPIRDEQGHQLYYMRPKLGADGLPMHDDSGHTIPELAPYLQNAGISVAVPAMFIADLASKNRINLD